MRIEYDLEDNRIACEYPYSDALNAVQADLYQSELMEAQRALNEIWSVQEFYRDESGDLYFELPVHKIDTLREAIDQLDEATTNLDLIEETASWDKRTVGTRESVHVSEGLEGLLDE